MEFVDYRHRERAKHKLQKVNYHIGDTIFSCWNKILNFILPPPLMSMQGVVFLQNKKLLKEYLTVAVKN